MKRRTPTPEEATERRKVAVEVAELAGERFKNLYGAPLGAIARQAFVDWITQEATDIDVEMLKNDVKSLEWQRGSQPAEWDRRKQWLNPPKGKRLLKALLAIVKEASTAMKSGEVTGIRVTIDGTDTGIESGS